MFEMTREQATRLARTSIGKNFLNSFSAKERLEGFSDKDLLEGIFSGTMLEGMSKEEILAHADPHFSNSEG